MPLCAWRAGCLRRPESAKRHSMRVFFCARAAAWRCDFSGAPILIIPSTRQPRAGLTASSAVGLPGEPVFRILRATGILGAALQARAGDPGAARRIRRHLFALALRQRASRRRAARILDLGTGSGCILLALLAERADAFGVGLDWSEEAVRTARDNARSLALAQRAAFLVGDWARALACASPRVRKPDSI